MNSKAQAWYMDFAIALLLFTFTLIVYFSYTNNFQKQEQGDLSLLLKDAKAISSSLVLSGYPADWNNITVIRIGVADEQDLNPTKIKNFKKLNYQIAKKDFATSYDYFVFFVNGNDEVLNINGVCGAGYASINTSIKIKSAYYYQDEDDSFLKSFMVQKFNADVYENDIFGLRSNLSRYDFIVMEHPLINDGDFKKVDDALNNYSLRGGLLMISGELVTTNGKKLIGATFKKKTGQSESKRTAVVNSTDPYLSLSIGQSMVFAQYYYIENDTHADPPADDLTTIAMFNETGDTSLARWKYGNGTVYFFSDFDVSNFNGDFVGLVEDATQSLVGGVCNPINITAYVSSKNLVKTERYLSYNSNPVKMVVYVWQ